MEEKKECKWEEWKTKRQTSKGKRQKINEEGKKLRQKEGEI
jgi:hypothetical protein